MLQRHLFGGGTKKGDPFPSDSGKLAKVPFLPLTLVPALLDNCPYVFNGSTWQIFFLPNAYQELRKLQSRVQLEWHSGHDLFTYFHTKLLCLCSEMALSIWPQPQYLCPAFLINYGAKLVLACHQMFTPINKSTFSSSLSWFHDPHYLVEIPCWPLQASISQ